MESLPAILQRVRRRGKTDVVDANFDDDALSSSDEDGGGDVAHEASTASGSGIETLKAQGASEKAISFIRFATTRGGSRPSWKPAPATAPCDVHPFKRAAFEVTSRCGDDQRTLRVSTDQFLVILPILYCATFRLREADIYHCGKTDAEVLRNFSLVKQLVK